MNEIKKLTELSNNTMLSKNYRDAIKWAIEQIQPETNARGEKVKAKGYPEEFEFLWGEIPKREGANSKRDAFKCCNARIKEGSTWRGLVQGLRRYKAYCETKKMIGTPYVMQMQKFFGTGKHFENEWTVNHEANARNTNQRLTAQEESDLRLLQQYGDASLRNTGSAGQTAGFGVGQQDVSGLIHPQVEQEGIASGMAQDVVTIEHGADF